MADNYKSFTKEIAKYVGTLKQEVPEAMEGFYNLSKHASKDGVLDEKTKEFLAMAISVTQRCDGCIGFHAKNLVRLGATKQEMAEVMAMCVYMGGGPALMYTANAMKAFEQFSE